MNDLHLSVNNTLDHPQIDYSFIPDNFPDKSQTIIKSNVPHPEPIPMLGKPLKTISVVVLQPTTTPSISLLPTIKRVARETVQYDKIPPNTPLKKEIEVNYTVASNILISHAKGRPILFGTAALAIYGLALRTDKDNPRNISLNIGHAWRQMGSATGGNQASHIHAAAGLVDDTHQRIIDEIICEKDITPKKKRLLQVKGFTEDDIELMKTGNFDIETVNFVFDTRWPSPEGKPTSILNGTQISDTLNLTNPISSHANTSCDKRLEHYLRQEIIKLYHACMHERISVEEATRKYCICIRDYFNDSISTVINYLPALAVYKEALEKTKEYPLLTADELEKQIKFLVQSLAKILNANFDEKQPSKSIKNDTQFLKKTKELFRITKKFLKDKTDIKEIQNHLDNHTETLFEEINVHIDHYQKYLEEAKLELEGTVEPDMDVIYKQLIKDYGLDKSENVEDKDLQIQMLSSKKQHGPKGDLRPHLEEKRKLDEVKASRAKRQRIPSAKQRLNFE